jgi:integrase
MPRYAKPLSARSVQSLKTRGFYCDGGGLYLQVSKGGSKSWVFRFALNGRKRDMGLGGFATFTLAEARERARKMRQLVASGIDPIDDRKAKRAGAASMLTFRQCAERYVAAHEASWRNGGAEWLASLAKHAFPMMGDMPVSAIGLSDVLRAIEPMWAKQPVRLNIVRNRIEMVLDWAKVRGLRQGENPARWKGHLETLLPSRKKLMPVKHRVALPYRQVGAFMTELRGLADTSARVLEFQILTAARSGEVVAARWDEIDMGERVWTIPPERMKAGREHRVPLNEAAIAVLKQRAAVRENEFVFPGRRPGQSLNVDASMRPIEKLGHKITAHGFRSAFRDWAAEQTNFPREIAEASLAHTIGDAVERAYQRGDFLSKRRQLIEAWGRYCMTSTFPRKLKSSQSGDRGRVHDDNGPAIPKSLSGLASHETRRSDDARLPLNVPRLGSRAHFISARGCRNGARPRHRQ